jgi:hypothetical protein
MGRWQRCFRSIETHGFGEPGTRFHDRKLLKSGTNGNRAVKLRPHHRRTAEMVCLRDAAPTPWNETHREHAIWEDMALRMLHGRGSDLLPDETTDAILLNARRAWVLIESLQRLPDTAVQALKAGGTKELIDGPEDWLIWLDHSFRNGRLDYGSPNIMGGRGRQGLTAAANVVGRWLDWMHLSEGIRRAAGN